MGWYIQAETLRGKIDRVIELGGVRISREEAPKSLRDVPAGKRLVVVVDNTVFQAALVCLSVWDFEEVFRADDLRPMDFFLLDQEVADKECGYSK